MICKKLHCLLNGHVEHVAYRLALVFYLKRFAVVSLALADLAGNVDVRKKVHFDLDYSVALASLAPAALDIERKSALGKAAHLCVVGRGKQRADVGEQSGVGRRV